MLRHEVEPAKASIEAPQPQRKQRSRRFYGALAAGAVATIVAGFPTGFFMADKRATDEQLTQSIFTAVQQDGFNRAEFRSGNVYSEYPVLTVYIGECALPATITVGRGQNGAIDTKDYYIHADSIEDTYISDVGSTEHEDRSGIVQSAQGAIERYQADDPCDVIQPGL